MELLLPNLYQPAANLRLLARSISYSKWLPITHYQISTISGTCLRLHCLLLPTFLISLCSGPTNFTTGIGGRRRKDPEGSCHTSLLIYMSNRVPTSSCRMRSLEPQRFHPFPIFYNFSLSQNKKKRRLLPYLGS